MPEIVQEIGAYAGLAAVVGLAVLASLYFSQARDVKRLREWAGRAPERSAEGVAAPQVAQRVVAQPQAKTAAAPGPVKGPPAVPGKPAPAAAAAAGASPNVSKATPVTAKPAAATPAAQKGQEAPAPAGGGKAAEAPGVPLPAAAKAAEATDTEATEAKPPVPVAAGAPASAEASAEAAGPGAPAAPGPSAQAGAAAPPKPADGAPPAGKIEPATPSPARGPSLPSTPAGGRRPPTAPPPRVPAPGLRGPRFPSREQQPSASETAVLQPTGRSQDAWFRRLLSSPRYLVLAIAGVLIIGGAAAFGLSQLGKNEAPPYRTETRSRFQDESTNNGKTKKAAVDPKTVTVSVLNGTTIPGLARSVGDKIEGFGFQLGNVTNNADQTRNESVVLFAPGGEREAAAVGKRLGIAQREPIDPQSQALGGDARVVVIAGADKTQ